MAPYVFWFWLLTDRLKIDELWDSMCQAAVGVIAKALPEVDNAESILKIKNLIALFMQTMNVRWAHTYPDVEFGRLTWTTGVGLSRRGL